MTTPIQTLITRGSRRAGIEGDLLRDYIRVETDAIHFTESDAQGNVNEVEVTIPAGVVIQEASRYLTNAELKTLDTDYIELVPAPGVGAYIQVMQVWARKDGADVPPEVDSKTYVTISPDVDLSAAEIAAALVGTIPAWAAGDRYLFVGRSVTDAPLERVGITTAGYEVYTQDLPMTALPGTMDLAGRPLWWYRSTDVVPQTLSEGFVSYIRQPVPTIGRLLSSANLALAFIGDATLALPIHSDDVFTFGHFYHWVGLLNEPDGALLASAIGGHNLIEGAALAIGHHGQRSSPIPGYARLVGGSVGRSHGAG